MKPISTTIIPAAPGFRLVYRKPYELGEAIIAWRVDTHATKDGEHFQTVDPLTCEGEPPSNFAGVLEPSGIVIVRNIGSYESLEAFAAGDVNATDA